MLFEPNIMKKHLIVNNDQIIMQPELYSVIGFYFKKPWCTLCITNGVTHPIITRVIYA
jgi:hypothetical protein